MEGGTLIEFLSPSTPSDRKSRGTRNASLSQSSPMTSEIRVTPAYQSVALLNHATRMYHFRHLPDYSLVYGIFHFTSVIGTKPVTRRLQ